MHQPKSTFDVWIMAARPRTLPAAASPVLVGVALGVYADSFKLAPAIAALLIALLMQIGANFANDVADFHHGADANGRLGPLRVTQAGLLSPRQVTMGMFVVFGLAAILGLYLAAISSWWIVIIGMLSIISALAYTGGPHPYGYYGLGEIFVFLFFGPIPVCGTYFVLTGTVTGISILASIPVGLLVTNILIVNNLRDIETDFAAGKHTMAVRLGERGSKLEYHILLVISYLLPLALCLLGLIPWWTLLIALSLPIAVSRVRAINKERGRALNRVLAGTAQLALVYSVLFSIGWVIASFLA
jgi:1,4-dihydroxy-2-naphthoate octaprenyltransferase